MSDGAAATRRFAEAFVATIASLREFTPENMAPYFHDDVMWPAGVMRLEGIDVFIAANNQAWQTRGRRLATRRCAMWRLMPAMVRGGWLHPFGYARVADAEPGGGGETDRHAGAMPAPLVFRLPDGRSAHLRTMTAAAGAMRVAASAA